MNRRALCAAVLALAAGLGAPATALAVGPDPSIPDPAAPGPYGFVRAEYNLPDLVTVGVGRPSDPLAATSTLLAMRLAGDLFYPQRGDGPFPVLVFMHGNHATCLSEPAQTLGAPVDPVDLLPTYHGGACSTGNPQLDAALKVDESRSYAGYDYLASRLATEGYVVASMDVNDITNWTNNAAESGYVARAEITSKTLDLLARWNRSPGPAGIGAALVGRLDMERVGVMGHSRGGEGVNMVAEYNATRPATPAEAAVRTDPEAAGRPEPVPDSGPRYDLKAVFSLAPVDGQGGRRPVVRGTQFATLLPYCDGDVFDLEGARVYERSKAALADGGHLAVQYAVNGANHDYFNTDWTDDDANLFGFGDPNCNVKVGPGRLAAADERQIGLTLIGGFLRDEVGGERQFDPIVLGRGLPPAACPNGGRDLPVGITCRDVVQTSTAPAGRRLLLGPAAAAAAPATTATGDPVTYSGFSTASACIPADSPGLDVATTGCGASPNRSSTPQLTLEWSQPSSLTVDLAAGHGDVSRFGVLSFRASENFTSPLQPPVEDVVRVAVADGAGHTATVASNTVSAALEPEPGTTARKQVLNGVRIPLSAFHGVDLADVRSIRLAVGSGAADGVTGSIQLADLALGEAAPPPADDRSAVGSESAGLPPNTAPTGPGPRGSRRAGGRGCPAATGRLAGTALGPLELGVTRAALARSAGGGTVRRPAVVAYCFAGGGIRAGFARSALLRGAPAAARRTLAGRAVLLLTANPRYALDGIHAGTPAPLALAGRHVLLLRVGANTWAVLRGRPATGLLKLTQGRVGEVGIAARELTATVAGARRFLRGFA